MPKNCNPRRRKPGESEAQYRKRCGPRPLGQIKMGEKKNPRIPRKKGQPRGSKKHSDLYTDENPKGTIKGLKFATVKDAKASVSKIKGSGKSHAHKIQAAVAMEQRAREMGKTSQAAVYRAFINKMKKITKKKNEQKGGGKNNPITKINLKAKPGEWIFKGTGKEYVGLYHKHADGTYMIGGGKLGLIHPNIPDEIIVRKKTNENVKVNHDGKAAPYGSGYEKVEEKKWSQKYKKSIDCSNPKGFSQKAHCAGKKKKSENVMKLTKSKLREMIEEEYFNYLVEKNVPTQPAKWSYYKSQAKKKFDVYPSAYANAWAAKQYKKAGGGWKKGK